MNKNIQIAFAVLVLITVVSSGIAVKLSLDLKKAKNPQAVAEAEAKGIAATVGELMILPKDEVPTVATVIDPEKIKSQPFFANAQKDDKVLIYTTAKKAILYRPSANKIIEVSALNIPTPENTPPAVQPEPTKTDTKADKATQ